MRDRVVSIIKQFSLVKQRCRGIAGGGDRTTRSCDHWILSPAFLADFLTGIRSNSLAGGHSVRPLCARGIKSASIGFDQSNAGAAIFTRHDRGVVADG